MFNPSNRINHLESFANHVLGILVKVEKELTMSTKIQNYFHQLKIVIVQRKIVIFSVQIDLQHHADDTPF